MWMTLPVNSTSYASYAQTGSVNYNNKIFKFIYIKYSQKTRLLAFRSPEFETKSESVSKNRKKP